MAFQGAFGVNADLRLARQAGGVTSATLKRQGTTDVAYSYVRLRPTTERTALGKSGTPNTTGMITAWRRGEADAPRVDDSWQIGSVIYQIVTVRKRFDADETIRSFCVYDCDVVTVP